MKTVKFFSHITFVIYDTVDPPLPKQHQQDLKGVQISEFVQISEIKPNILDTAVSNLLKNHTQHKIQICTTVNAVL